MRSNTGRDGSLNTAQIASALLQYHNTPLREGGKSPAQLLLGRQLRGGVPISITQLRVTEHWRAHLDQREKMMAQKATALEEASSKRRSLAKLKVGQSVRVQDPVTKRWDRAGVITRVLRPIRQYTVRLDGSGRLVLRNRKHLRLIPSSTDTIQEPSRSEGSAEGLAPVAGPRRSERLLRARVQDR